MIKSHKELAEQIAGKRVLLLNSLGKDSVACLAWLEWAGVEVVSVTLDFHARHPGDEPYLKYLIERFKSFTFVRRNDTQELNKFRAGMYQSPMAVLKEFNHWEHTEFSMDAYIEDLRKIYNCDFVCWGMSKYESVARASGFYKKGLMQGTDIYPLGLLDKKQVLEIAKTLKLHPCYKTAKGTYDFPSWYKMRSAFILNPEYWETMKSWFPLIELDKFRYEVLLGKK